MNDAYHALIGGQRKGIAAELQRSGLRCLSWGYRFGVGLRNWAYDRGWKQVHRVAVPVVSIGNLTTGGTGKTPCVEYIARFYRNLDLQVALLSRGYGSEVGRNDEAMVLEENLPDVPHLQDPDRVQIAQTAVDELESEVLVLDDGFQHRRLHRDLDVVLIDATNPWGHGYLLPRGLLREPIGGLKRADAVILTRCDLVAPETLRGIHETVVRIKPLPIAEATHRPAGWRSTAGIDLPIDALAGRSIAAFCGLGNPEAFRQTLVKLGMNVIAWRVFPDHHPYSRDDIEDLRNWARQLPTDAVVVTTQKDLVKIRLDRLGERDLWALRIAMNLTSGQEALEELLRKTVTLYSPPFMAGLEANPT